MGSVRGGRTVHLKGEIREWLLARAAVPARATDHLVDLCKVSAPRALEGGSRRPHQLALVEAADQASTGLVGEGLFQRVKEEA